MDEERKQGKEKRGGHNGKVRDLRGKCYSRPSNIESVYDVYKSSAYLLIQKNGYASGKRVVYEDLSTTAF